MKGVKNKPDFYEVYKRVSNVACKFEFQKETEISNKKD